MIEELFDGSFYIYRMNRNEITLENWNKLAQAYQNKFMEIDLYNDSYDQFCDAIKKDNASVLELGCGPGNITKYILDKKPNYSILATDTAPSMIVLGKINVPNAQFQLLDVRDMKNLHRTFDAIIGGFVVPYLNTEEVKNFIFDSIQLLNDDGILYFSCIEKDTSYSESQTSSDGKITMEVNYHDRSLLMQILEKNQFNIVSVFHIDYPKPNSTSDVHLVIIAQKKS
ncbi:MAG: methyltransferase domain-containing protein [Flavobacterium sp.]|jgi:cyclopropane fatty-acyl-phospholipid synthase-like methyltransferase|uniref:Methyltransferase domain-containing protein n=1 Tax=Flavobacterium macrobrachii TaxID=591204 RepID=A0ABS2D2V2_9FLAO|nr:MULTISPECIES: class I SAM-dependent methyltransferase [Flavobacterium]MBM6500710.1 methyltransferase domain-containing protein [Flavobacterium macrobrachii]MCZ8090230.1 methyltransferase domain-containing protein [Flavobacterium sp.]MCZ8331565.1 methyltransferase domain-containing protein [Flavobacterium sp.]